MARRFKLLDDFEVYFAFVKRLIPVYCEPYL
jgi:hypothetical protein